MKWRRRKVTGKVEADQAGLHGLRSTHRSLTSAPVRLSGRCLLCSVFYPSAQTVPGPVRGRRGERLVLSRGLGFVSDWLQCGDPVGRNLRVAGRPKQRNCVFSEFGRWEIRDGGRSGLVSLSSLLLPCRWPTSAASSRGLSVWAWREISLHPPIFMLGPHPCDLI